MSKDLCVGKAYVFPDESNPFDKLVADNNDVLHKTNADRIRKMTDEELAKILYMGCEDRNWDTCKISEKCDEQDILSMSDEEEDAICIQCWLDWLRQGADKTKR